MLPLLKLLLLLLLHNLLLFLVLMLMLLVLKLLLLARIADALLLCLHFPSSSTCFALKDSMRLAEYKNP